MAEETTIQLSFCSKPSQFLSHGHKLVSDRFISAAHLFIIYSNSLSKPCIQSL